MWLKHCMTVFPVFGLPAIIHSDNGKEFVKKKLIEDVVSK